MSYRTRTDTPSVFTRALAEELALPGSVEAAIHRVRDRVAQETQERPYGSQQPEIRNRLGHEVSLLAAAGSPGPVAGDGAARPSSSPPVASLTSPPGSPRESFRDCLECPEMVRIPPGTFLMGSPEDERQRASGEGPVHEVHIGYTFAVSKFPVTRGEWRRYLVEAGRDGSQGCRGFNHALGKWALTPEYGWSDPGFRQDETHPVVCISWSEAQDYAAWLSIKTGHHYRLLSEAEFEYVERAGSHSAYPWGPTSEGQCERVNGADTTAQARFPEWTDAASCTDGFLFTSPVDRFPATAFGLHDILGNVRYWMQDCYHDSYRGAPTDGSAWESGDCSMRVVRGGGWDSRPSGLRAAYRLSDLATTASDGTGVRLARTEPPPPAVADR
jgi:formylglycine-generating enzyme required for sulfatase activity